MKLYINDSGEWFGTQALAKQRSYDWWPVDVPTDKPSLIEWLNENVRKDKQEPIITFGPVTQGILRQHPWQSVREMAEQASLRDLGVALAVLMDRLEEAAEREEVS